MKTVMGVQRIPTIQELRASNQRHTKRIALAYYYQDYIYYKTRRPQRCWKEHRKTRYHRLAGMTQKQVNQHLDFWFKYYIERRLKQAGLDR